MRPNKNSAIRINIAFYIILLIILSTIVISAKAGVNEQIYKELGNAIKTDAPASGSALDKARYAYEKYCDFLDSKGKNFVNQNLWGRLQHLGTELTCQDHMENLQDVLNGMGENKGMPIVGKKDKWLPISFTGMAGIPFQPDVNTNHAALVIFDDNGEPFVFDAWMMAVIKQQEYDEALSRQFSGGKAKANPSLYSGARMNKFNGMPLKDWIAFVRNRGYVKFCSGEMADKCGDETNIEGIVRGLSPKSNQPKGQKLDCTGHPAINAEGCWLKEEGRPPLEQGHWVYYYDTARKHKSGEGDYQKGVKVGRWITYSNDGRIIGDVNIGEGQSH